MGHIVTLIISNKLQRYKLNGADRSVATYMHGIYLYIYINKEDLESPGVWEYFARVRSEFFQGHALEDNWVGFMLTTINNNASTWLAMQQLIHSSNFFISIDEVERHKVGYLHTGDLQQIALYMLQCGYHE